jgi:hypothetical protein
MKKGVLLLASLVCLPAWSQGWKLPVFTLAYDVAAGESEDDDGEALLPASLRHTAALRIKEDVGTASFGFSLRGSIKDYYLQTGDYAYLDASHDGSFKPADQWKVGYSVGVKGTDYPETDAAGLSKNTLALKAGVETAFAPFTGTSFDAAVSGRGVLAENPADPSQTWAVSAGLATRLGEWQLGARFRGEIRLPMGAASTITSTTNAAGSISVRWDPNR